MTNESSQLRTTPAVFIGSVSAVIFGLFTSIANGQTLIRVAQEPVPGMATNNPTVFDSNVLGVVQAWDRTSQTPRAVYNPGTYQYRGDLLDAFGGGMANRVHVMFAQCAASTEAVQVGRCQPPVSGTTLVWIMDKGGTSSGGGHAKTIVRVVNDPSACSPIFDGFEGGGDSDDPLPSPSNDMQFVASNSWNNQYTDGYEISQLIGAWRLEAKFSDYPGSNQSYGVLAGLDSWHAYSDDGSSIPLTLVVNQTTEFRSVGTCDAVAWPSYLYVCPAATTTLHVSTGATSPSISWYCNGSLISNAHGSTLSLAGSSNLIPGIFTSRVSTTCGIITSNAITVTRMSCTCTSDFNNDGDSGTDADIETFFACLAGNCCPTCPGNADFNGDGDVGTDADIESFFRVLAGGPC